MAWCQMLLLLFPLKTRLRVATLASQVHTSIFIHEYTSPMLQPQVGVAQPLKQGPAYLFKLLALKEK